MILTVDVCVFPVHCLDRRVLRFDYSNTTASKRGRGASCRQGVCMYDRSMDRPIGNKICVTSFWIDITVLVFFPSHVARGVGWGASCPN